MKVIRWSTAKNEWLRTHRGITFEEILLCHYVVTRNHPRRRSQKLLLFDVEGYIWVIPYVEDEQTRFLKTAYPDRKYTKAYHRGELT